VSSESEAEDAPDVAPHGGAIRRLLMKHPFWIATIFGLLFFPTLKFCSIRHEPPIPVLGQVSSAALTTSLGEHLQLPLATGQSWLVVMVAIEDTRTTPAVVSALRDLQTRLQRERSSIPVVALIPPGASSEATSLLRQRLAIAGGVTHVATGVEHDLISLRESLAPALGPAVNGLHPVARIGLIDGSGGIRAGAPIGAIGLDELTRRAVALERERDGP
jgi:hypothetical protein